MSAASNHARAERAAAYLVELGAAAIIRERPDTSHDDAVFMSANVVGATVNETMALAVEHAYEQARKRRYAPLRFLREYAETLRARANGANR